MIDNFQIQETLKRYEDRTAQRTRNERLINEGRLLEVDTPQRVDKFLKRRGLATDVEGGVTVERTSAVMAGEVAGMPAELALERFLGINDLMGVAFLEEGLRVARTIARIWVSVSSGQPAAYGTGFMVSPQLLMTNHHVLGDVPTARNSLAEFDYQRRADGTLVSTTVFKFEPQIFFYANQELDYAVVSVSSLANNGRPLSEFGHNLLSEEEGKAIAAQWGNIVQHPGGEPKQVSLRENQIVDVLPNFLHYKSDTAPGSSGAAVYNDRWEIVALHHSGVPDKTEDGRIRAVDGAPWRPEMGEDRIKWIANEGVRISRITGHLRAQLSSDAHRALFNSMLATSSEMQPLVADPGKQVPASAAARSERLTTSPDGSATWTIPLTVSVNLGAGGALAAQPILPVLYRQ
jgi:endonuclease G